MKKKIKVREVKSKLKLIEKPKDEPLSLELLIEEPDKISSEETQKARKDSPSLKTERSRLESDPELQSQSSNSARPENEEGGRKTSYSGSSDARNTYLGTSNAKSYTAGSNVSYDASRKTDESEGGGRTPSLDERDGRNEDAYTLSRGDVIATNQGNLDRRDRYDPFSQNKEKKKKNF